jgi:transcriptional regulator with XRE-family HTH domain
MDWMEDLKQIIANNIINLRKQKNLTQADLAETLGYTDKAISKWERAESIPDVIMLKQIADLFGVSLNYLVEAEHAPSQEALPRRTKNNRLVIALLAAAAVWFIATVLFVYLKLYGASHPWLVFMGAVPVCMIVLLVFNSIWGKKAHAFIIISILVWSALAFAYLLLLPYNLFLIFVIGIPIQVLIILWSQIKTR